ncbi:MAG: hypothetical protein HOP29_18180 [Phycisphaerales bacterium]|nr:hypothetical protein [Phycisphaerales bacterium]
MECSGTESQTASRAGAGEDAPGVAGIGQSAADERGDTRRAMMGRTSRLLVYTVPVIQLFRTPAALAGSGVSPVS